MDSFEINKLIGGLLGTCFVVFSVGLVSDALFASPAPEKPGFAIEATEPAEGGPAAPAAAAKPIADLLADRQCRSGCCRLQEMPGLPFRRKGRPEQGRPRSVGPRRPSGGRA